MTKTLTHLPAFLHGGDYNPEQWSEEVWDEDIRLMKLAGVNAPTLCVFAWVALEPEPGVYDFTWLDRIIEKLSASGISFVLATPSAATPQWMSQLHPETLRVRHDGVRHPHKVRVNYCNSSPIYRQAARNMAKAMAKRYGKHPNLLLWHINNEYHDDCHCDICQNNFRDWLQKRYGTLHALNQAWWTRFWCHEFTDWSQLRSPQPWPHGEWSIQGLSLDWRRFTGEQHAALFDNEAAAIRPHSPGIPLTHNMHALLNDGLITQWKVLAPKLDVVSWDNYPHYQDDAADVQRAVLCAFQHNVYRGLNGGRPYMMMESNPTSGPGSKQQRPGALRRTALQAIGHGSDSVMYFQWRNGRGEMEKFHGAMVEHVGHEHTRYFKEVVQIGQELQNITEIIGSDIPSDVAIIFDQEIHWSLELSTNARWDERDYIDACISHYTPLWQAGTNVTVVPPEYDLSSYKLVIAPLLHLLSPAAIEQVTHYVANGGCLVLTYWSGYVNESDLCFKGGFPGPLKELAGLWVEELDGIPAGKHNGVSTQDKTLNLAPHYEAIHFADLIRPLTASVLATFEDDYLAGQPALTHNNFGKGSCYYIGFQPKERLLDDLYSTLIDQCGVHRNLKQIPYGVSVQRRSHQHCEYLFVHNFACETTQVLLDGSWINMSDQAQVVTDLVLNPRDSVVIKKKTA